MEDIDGNPYEDGPKKYVLYKSYNNACFCAQIEDVDLFYVLHQKLKRKEPIPVKIHFKAPDPDQPTRFPIFLKNSEGDEVIVHFSRDQHDKNKFMKTRKYERAKEYPESWEFS